MGDEVVELDLEFGTVVGEDAQYGRGRFNSREEEESNYDPYFDVADDDDSNYVDGLEAGTAVKEEEDAEDDNQGLCCQDSATIKKNSKEKEEMMGNDPRRPRVKLVDGPPPSLLHLATRIVAITVEKYPPEAIGALSEHHWEGVVRARVANRARKMEPSKIKKGLVKIGFDGGGQSTKKMLPALSEKFLLPIEIHPRNPHLSKSKAADELLWRDIVEYNFSGVMNRPTSLEVPCEVLKERLRGWGERLVELAAQPMCKVAYLTKQLEAQCSKKESHDAVNRDDVIDDLFGDGECLGNEAVTHGDFSPSEEMALYQSYLEVQSRQRTKSLCQILRSLRRSPMDVKLLAETQVGKSASKALKALKKLGKKIKNADNDRQREECLGGYPQFWKTVSWGQHQQPQQQHQRQYQHTKGGHGDDLVMTPLEFLMHMLQDWKDMALSESGVTDASDASPPAKKRKAGDEESSNFFIATCGRDNKLSVMQHAADMSLLHSSPDWRSLYQSLREREGIMRRSHGDRVRSIRENLERDRPRIGKVVLKRVVGRVRAGGMDDSVGMGQSLRGTGGALIHRNKERREAILSKSLGHKALQQQQLSQNALPFFSNGKLSQLRQETRVASMRAGRSSAKKPSFSYSVATSSFGASVARAGGGGGAGKKQQAQKVVQLKGGKQMKLPPSSSGGQSKTLDVFSSLQMKKSRQEQQRKMERKKVNKLRGGVAASTNVNHGKGVRKRYERS